MATLMAMGSGWPEMHMAGLPCLLELDDSERFCLCCGECWRPVVGKGPLPSARTINFDPCGAVRPSKAFPLPTLDHILPPPSQSGVDIACTNSTTTERQSRRPKALATYLGSPHAAFVVRVSSMLLAGWLASWLDGWLQLAAAG